MFCRKGKHHIRSDDNCWHSTDSLDVLQLEHIRTSGILDTKGAAEDPSQDMSQDLMMVNVFRWLYTSGKAFDPCLLLPCLYTLA